jgi:hypothetical protein
LRRVAEVLRAELEFRQRGDRGGPRGLHGRASRSAPSAVQEGAVQELIEQEVEPEWRPKKGLLLDVTFQRQTPVVVGGQIRYHSRSRERLALDVATISMYSAQK